MVDNSENQRIKEGIKLLFDNLFENKLIFHERVTILCELMKYELKDDRFSVELKAIKALNNNSEGKNRMYQHIISKPTFTVWSKYTLGDYKIFDGKKIGMPYCSFDIFGDITIVEKVCQMSDTEIDDNLYSILWNS